MGITDRPDGPPRDHPLESSQNTGNLGELHDLECLEDMLSASHPLVIRCMADTVSPDSL